MQNYSRRRFIKQMAFIAAAVPCAGMFGHSVTALAKGAKDKALPIPAGQTPVPPTDAVAIALGYKASVKDIDYTKYPQRKKPDAKNQFCNNCMHYTKSNDSWGKCLMITSGLVASEGWCGSWSKKS